MNRSLVLVQNDVVAVSPDLGSVTRTRAFAEGLNIPIAIVDKRRPRQMFLKL